MISCVTFKHNATKHEIMLFTLNSVRVFFRDASFGHEGGTIILY